MGICLEKFKLCLFSVPFFCGFFMSGDECHTDAGHNISYIYAPNPNLFCCGCRCVRKVVEIACLRLKLLTVSNVFWYCEIAQVQYYSLFTLQTYRCIVFINISVNFVALQNNFLHHQNMLVSNFNVVTATPFTNVLMVSTCRFLQQYSKLFYTTSSGALLPTPST